MYSSPFIMQTLISLLLFHLQDSCSATEHSVLMRMRLRAQRRSLVDSPLSDAFLSSSGNHPTRPEEVSKYELTTPSSSSRNILVVDKSDPGPLEQSQQSWLGQDPGVDNTLLLTLCTTTNTDETDHHQSLLLAPPSAKFQRRQTTDTRVPKACPPERVSQPAAGQQNMKLDVQGQGRSRRKKIPQEETRPAAEAEKQKVDSYPNALELFKLDRFGRAGNSHSICDGFVGQSIPMCAPSSLLIPVSPPNWLAPSRFWSEINRCIAIIEEFWCCSKGRELDRKTVIDDTIAWDNPDKSPSPHRAPSAYPAAGWMCSRSEDERAFRTW